MFQSKLAKTKPRSFQKDRKKRARLFEQLEQRMMLASDWTNAARPYDVNNDMKVTALDALLVINAINADNGDVVLGPRTNPLALYLDPSGDSRSTALDALIIVNELNQQSSSGLSNAPARIEGEAEPAPVGFVSIVMGNLPGRADQVVSLTTQMTVGETEFNEMGLFLMDGLDGAVHGVMPSSPNYGDEVFASAMRQVLYSKRDVFRTASDTEFPGGSTLGVYVLQATSDNGDSDKHLRARPIDASSIRIGWEEHVSPFSGWEGVGDRGYDDAMVDIQISTPVDGNATPVITAIADRSINEEVEFTLQSVVRDIDLPDDTLTYSLDAAPEGASLDSTTGVFRWNPTEVQGPGNYEVIIRATDALGAFDTESFLVRVLEVNSPPVLDPISIQQSQPGSTVSLVARASDRDLPANRLTFTLSAGAPLGASIDPATGQFGWTIPLGTPASSVPITVRVTDNGIPALSDSKSFLISIAHVNAPPILGNITDQTINEESLLSFQLTSTDVDLPNDALTYSLDSGPSGAILEPQTGQFRWTPTEAQGPGRSQVIARVTDGSGAFDTKTFFVDVLEVNRAPTLAPLANANAKPGDTITLTASATDPDLPANTLRYSLGSSAPAGAMIDPITGIFIWNIPQTISSGNYSIPIRVSDNGSPALFDEETFTVFVADCQFGGDVFTVTSDESGGSSTGHGTVSTDNCVAVLREGDSFVVTLEAAFTVPTASSAIQFDYSDLSFDTADPSFINDAFEVALVDEYGNALVRNFTSGRDAFFNITEGLTPAFREGVSVNGNTVTVGLNGLPPDTKGRLILRLVNNDTDTLSTVAINRVAIVASDLLAAAPQNDPFSLQRSFAALTKIQIDGMQRPASLPSGPRTVSTGQAFAPPPLTDPTPLNPVLEWSWTSSQIEPNSVNVMMTPTVIDLNGDDTPEIIFSTFAGNGYSANGILRAISGRDGSELWNVVDPAWRVLPTSHIAVGDIDLDGFPEIIAMHGVSGLIAFEHDGSFKWQSEPVWGPSYGGGPALADLDQDGVPEVIYGGTVLDNEGRILWRGDASGGTGRGGNSLYGSLSVVADLDLDGFPEVVAGSSAYRHDGTLFWNSSITDGYAAVGNFNADPYPEIVVITYGKAYLLDHLGEIQWGPVPITSYGFGGAPTIADFDGDGMPEIGVAGRYQYTVLETDGTVKWSVNTHENSVAITGSSVFDFDGNGRAEVVYGDENSLDIYDGIDGSILFTFPRGNATVSEYPVVADVDGDGQAELVAVATTTDGININGTTGIYVFGGENGWAPTRPLWNQHTYHITNINDDGSIPAHETNGWEIYNNYRQNLQPTGTRLGPPLISVSSPDSSFAIGTQVVLQGHATAQGVRSNGQPNSIDAVFVNGIPVDTLDAAGNFFARVLIESGQSEFLFTALDATEQQVAATLQLTGVEPSTIDFARYADVTGAFSGVYYRTSFEESTKQLFVDLATRNDGQFTSDVPLLVGVKNISDPTVTPLGIDGFTPDGIPYYDFSSFVTSGRLLPNQETSSPTISFHNPTRQQFDYELVFYGKLNEPPIITTTPTLGAFIGQPYVYDVDATDAENDTLAYALNSAPRGMSIDAQTGRISWPPTTADRGTHAVSVHVSDGRGGAADQSFALSVTAAPPNRPPVITSVPVTEAFSATATRIQSGEFDRDQLFISSSRTDEIRVYNRETLEFVRAFTHPAFQSPATSNYYHGPNGIAFNERGNLVVAAFYEFIEFSDYGVEFARYPKAIEESTEKIAFDPFGNMYTTTSTGGSNSLNQYRASDYRFIQTINLPPEATSLTGVTFDKVGRMYVASQDARMIYVLEQSNETSPYQVTRSFQAATGGFGPESMQLSLNGELVVAGGDIFRYAPGTGQVLGDFDAPDDTFPVPLSVDSEGNIYTADFEDNTGFLSADIIRFTSDGGSFLRMNDPQLFGPIAMALSGNILPHEAMGTYQYDVAAIDPDNDAVSYSLSTFPAAMSIDPFSGLIQWAPTSEQIGGHFVGVRVIDGRGGVAEQKFFVCVHPDPTNHAPAIVSQPTTAAVVNSPSDYWVQAVDPDSDSLRYSLTASPSGMTINDATGLIQWSPTETGEFSVVVRVADGRGGVDLQTYTIAVFAALGEIRGNAFDDLDADGVRLGSESSLAGWMIYLDQNGSGQRDAGERVTFTDAIGDYVFDKLPPATYIVREEQRSSWKQTFPSTTRVVPPNERGYADQVLEFFDAGAGPLPGPYGGAGNVWPIPISADVVLGTPVLPAGLIGSIDDDWLALPTGSYVTVAFQDESIIDGPGPDIFVRSLDPSISAGEYADVFVSADGTNFVYLGLASQAAGFEGFDLTDIGFTRSVVAVRVVGLDALGSSPGFDLVSVEVFPGSVGPSDGSHVVALGEGQIVTGRDFGNQLTGTPAATSTLQITSTPPQSISTDARLRYDVQTNLLPSAVKTFDLPLAPTGITIHPQLGVLIWQPTVEQVGTHSVVVRVTDSQGNIALQSFQISVNRPNLAPLFVSEPVSTFTPGTTYRYQVSAIDPNGDALTYTIESGPQGMSLSSADREITWLPPADFAPESVQVTIVVDDESSQTRQQFTIQKQGAAANRLPHIDSQPRIETGLDIPYFYQVQATDPDNESITYQMVAGPSGMTISPQGLVTWTPISGQLGAHPVSVRVIDARGGQDEQPYSLSVVATPSNIVPFITSTPRLSAINGQPYEYRATARDADNDPLEWTLLQAPTGMFVDPQTGIVRWTPANEKFASHPVILQARDPLGGTARQQFNVEVRCTNLPPAIVSIPPTIALDGRSYLYAVRAEDVERDQIAFFLDQSPTGMGIDRLTGLIRWVPTTAQRGEQTVAIRAIDTSGGVGTQTYTIVVSDPATPSFPGDPNSPPLGNTAPVINSTPNFNGEVLFEYQYDVNALDKDGDDVTYSLGQSPSGMTIDAASGLIRWTPAANQLGPHDVTVTARDPYGATANQGFVLLVEQNQPPTITSTAPTAATRGATYRYTVRATDPDGDPLRYSLTAGAPTGMTIDPNNGRILWDTAGQTLGNHPVEVRVTDDHGQSDQQSFTLTLGADTQAPNVNLVVISGARALVGDTIIIDPNVPLQLRVQGSDNVGVIDRGITLSDQPLTLDPAGTAMVTLDQPGVFTVVATVFDAEGNVGTATRTIRILDPNDVVGPVVHILSPADSESTTSNNAAITYLKPIIGTVDDPDDNLDFWNVYIARMADVDIYNIELADPHYKRIGSGTTEVQAGKLATFDPTLLTNDRYVVFVEAFDINGQGTIRGITLDVDGNAKLGNFRLEFTDLTIPLAGIPIQINRVYDTLQANDQGDFGFGWSLGILDGDIRETVPDYGSNLFNIGTAPFKRDTRVYITTPDGRRLGFTFDPKPFVGPLGAGGLFGQTYIPKFKADPGVIERLDVPEGIHDDSNIVALTANGTAIIPFIGVPYNPDTYILTMADGTQYTYDQRSGLQSVVDLSGNTLTVTHNGIFHSSGQSIDFVRDSQDRITQIVDPDGNLRDYQYNAAGNLVSYTTRKAPGAPVNNDGFTTIAEPPLTTTYAYFNSPAHFLKTITDPLGHVVLQAEFDADGRLIGITDAVGGRVQQGFDPANFTGTITDARGNITKLLYNKRGNVLTQTDPLGGVKRYEYGDSRNPDKETRVIDKRGNIIDRTYDTSGNILTITERGSTAQPLSTPVVTGFTYDTGNHVTGITNALLNSTQFSYDTSGHLTNLVNALGDSSAFTYDGEGRRESFTDFNGNTTTFEYNNACPCGSPSRVIFADGTHQRFEYNFFGQVTRESTFEADGTLVETRRTKYDFQGRKIVEFGGMGEVTEYHYDGNRLVDQLTLIDYVNGDPKLRLTHYEHDNADRVVRQVDTGFIWPTGTNIYQKINEAVAAAETIVNFRYDADGNRILLQDPVGNITTWAYDTNNRVVEERDPFYNENLTIDQAVAALAVPSGVDITVNQAADHVRAFGYDSEGNQIEVIDRNGRRREFDYDFAGRLMEELWFTADTGTLVETIDFSYDNLGNMVTATDFNSNHVFTYDTLNRLKSVDNNPDGTRDVPRVILNYGYDAQGNVISTSDDAGVTVASTYNSRNQLATRSWFDATPNTTPDVNNARVDFLYNAAGRESESRRYSDLTASTLVGRTIRTYDVSGRSNLLTHRNAVDELLAGYDYDYEFSGLLTHEERTHQDAQFAQSIDYRYDLTGQLVDAIFSGQDDEHYEYDANGNRIMSTVGEVTRNYTTDSANQLQSDGTYRYEYDGEGNQVKRVHTESGETRTFQYDHRNRLTRVDDWIADPGDPNNPVAGSILTQTVEYTYDALGRRVARSVDVNESNPQLSDKESFVYNGNNVWADFNQSGRATMRYLSGNRVDQSIASMKLNDHVDWYLRDRLGTTRVITGNSGDINNSIEYHAFGKTIDVIGLETERYLYMSREYDSALDMSYFRTRYLVPETGRFAGRDSIGHASGDSNLYRFVGNAPTAFTDPTGNFAITGDAQIVASIAALQLSLFVGIGVADFYIDEVCKIDVSAQTRDQIRALFGVGAVSTGLAVIFLAEAGGIVYALSTLTPGAVAVINSWTPAAPSLNDLVCLSVRYYDRLTNG